ncbi:MAG: hypothetical protein ACI3ZZ_05790 [Candidatus Aphodosoma sp.]
MSGKNSTKELAKIYQIVIRKGNKKKMKILVIKQDYEEGGNKKNFEDKTKRI